MTPGRRHAAAGVIALALVALPWTRAGADEYGYPVDNPLLATVIGTRQSDAPELPRRVPSSPRRLPRVDPARIPGVFWDQAEVRYAVALQDDPAALVFLIAGTGSRYSSEKMKFLEALLWGSGYHVASISSPTHPDFILTASRNHIPGYMPADVADLYALMDRIRDAVAAEIDVTDTNLIGFSLGATQAGFLAAHDSRHRVLEFRRVLLLNPAVDVYDSVGILDRMFEQGTPDGGVSTDQLITDLLRRLTPYLHEHNRSRVEDEFLYALAAREHLTDHELRAIIGTVFRLSLANLVFTTDVMSGGGHVVEPGAQPGATTPLTQYLKRAARFTFARYLEEILLPGFKRHVPNLDRDTVVRAASLESIRGFLAGAAHVGVMTNADDIILKPENLAFVRETFGDRAIIYPRGGHGGNLAYATNAAHVLEFLADTRRP